ncbi:TIR domain-containing protein [Aureicoccus marinus]|uniref:TIR domain-containing protein n=1 Tax=Aureicoccus marinus TaxID=754435 RepID=A0A2S7T6C8_9FLAO|nr:TIR domain-containing protein [Aureicoccus marinus]PQJ15006.1 hypothetical protein BST99_04005 [Aureicoccus marinus]
MTSETLFFSYSRDDSEFVLRLANQLRGAGASIWLDQLDIAPGNHWDSTIEEALQASGYLLVVLSKTSVESNNVMDEVSFAMEEDKKVIPLLVEDCEIPFRLRRLQQADFKESYRAGLEQLIQALDLKEEVTHKLLDEKGNNQPKSSEENTRTEPVLAKEPTENVQVKEPVMAFSTGSSERPSYEASSESSYRPRRKSRGWVLPLFLLILILSAGAATYLCVIPDYLGLSELVGSSCQNEADQTALSLCADLQSVDCYTAIITSASSSNQDIAKADAAVREKLSEEGYIQYSESDGSARYFDQLLGDPAKEPAAGDLLIATRARNVRDGVIGVDEVAERNGDVIDEKELIVVSEAIMSGTAIWIKINYTND